MRVRPHATRAASLAALFTAAATAAAPLVPAQELADAAILSIALPEPWGLDAVGVHTAVVVDSSRQVLTDDGRRIARPILARIWYPAQAADSLDARPIRPYMHPRVAEAWRGTLPAPPGWERAVATNAIEDAAPIIAPDALPVLVFSHGLSWPVENYQILLEDLASRGWVVVGVSHPGAETLTRLPDGTLIPYAVPSWDDEEVRAAVLMDVVDDMVLDAGLVIDWLALKEADPDWPLRGRLELGDAARIGYWGHSLGGAAAAWTQERDPRIGAAASWEGQVYRSEDRPLTVSGPLLYVVGGANRAELAGRHFRGAGLDNPVLEVVLRGAWHASPSDVLYIYRRYAPRDWQKRHRREITARRTNQITADLLDAFFSRYLLGADKGNLLGPIGDKEPFKTQQYPEVELRMNLGHGNWTAGGVP